MSSSISRITYVDALNAALEGNITPEVADKLEALRATLMKRKTSGERKPTAKQTANAGVRAALVEYINSTPTEEGFLVTDLIKDCPAVAGKSQQYVSAILRQARLANEVSKVMVKRRARFVPFDPTLPVED